MGQAEDRTKDARGHSSEGGTVKTYRLPNGQEVRVRLVSDGAAHVAYGGKETIVRRDNLGSAVLRIPIVP